MSFISNLLAIQGAVNNQTPNEQIIGGLIVPGSWDPTTGTAQVVMLDTLAILSDTGDSPTIVQAHEMTGYGNQYGPRGGERVHLHRTDEGWAYTYIHWDDDSPNTQQGQKTIAHYDVSGSVDAYISFTNDSSISGDGKAGILIQGGKTITVNTVGGLSVIIDDNTGTVQIANSGNSQPNSVIRATDEFSNLTAFKNAMVAANVPNAGAVVVPPLSTLSSSTKTFSG